MKKVFTGEYKEDIAKQVEEYLKKNLPEFTGNGEAVIVEIIPTDIK